MERVPLTIRGHKKIEEEIKHLKMVDRPAVIAMIEEARAHGDLSENAEYQAAKEKQSFIETRIMELESVLSRSQVIDTSHFETDTIKFGAKVELVDEDTKKTQTYQIVGELESDVANGLISINSPIAKALIGKKQNQVIEYNTPKGEKMYRILTIAY